MLANCRFLYAAATPVIQLASPANDYGHHNTARAETAAWHSAPQVSATPGTQKPAFIHSCPAAKLKQSEPITGSRDPLS